MDGIYIVRNRITGATQFSDASPCVTFVEFSSGPSSVNALPPDHTAWIIGWAYNSQGDPHDALLTLRPQSNIVPNADDQIVLQAMTAENSFTQACGVNGMVVPKAYGIFSQDVQPPVSPVTLNQTFRMFFSTTGKSADATLFVWYRIAKETP